MNTPRLSALTLACLLALPAAGIAQQTSSTTTPVVTPPRAITSQTETQGADATLQLTVAPNTSNSSITIPIPSSGGGGGGAVTPPVTCRASQTTQTETRTITPTVTQTAACPAAQLTTSGQSTFTQSATQTDRQTATETTTTTCPAGAYGAPRTTTSTSPWTTTASSTGPWAPTPADACPIHTVNKMPINGQTYGGGGLIHFTGGFYTSNSIMNAVFEPNGTYVIDIHATSGIPPGNVPAQAQGTWLPAGRSPSDFSLTMTLSNIQCTGQDCSEDLPEAMWPHGVAGNPGELGPDGVPSAGVTSLTVPGTEGVAVAMQGGSHYRAAPPLRPNSIKYSATVTVTIKDLRYGTQASTSFTMVAGGLPGYAE